MHFEAISSCNTVVGIHVCCRKSIITSTSSRESLSARAAQPTSYSHDVVFCKLLGIRYPLAPASCFCGFVNVIARRVQSTVGSKSDLLCHCEDNLYLARVFPFDPSQRECRLAKRTELQMQNKGKSFAVASRSIAGSQSSHHPSTYQPSRIKSGFCSK